VESPDVYDCAAIHGEVEWPHFVLIHICQ